MRKIETSDSATTVQERSDIWGLFKPIPAKLNHATHAAVTGKHTQNQLRG